MTYEMNKYLNDNNYDYVGILEDKAVYKNKDKVLWGDNMEMAINSDIAKDIMKRCGVRSEPGNAKGFQKYFNKSRDIHNDIVKGYQELRRTMDKIESNYNDVMKDPNISMIDKEKEREYYKQAQANYNIAHNKILAELEDQLHAVYTDMEKDVTSFYTPNGADIDAETVALINSGIKLNVAEFDRMIDKYADNYTMSRILCDYAVKNEVETMKSRALNDFMSRNQPGKNKEMEIIRRLHDTTRMALNDNDPIRAQVRRDNYDGIYNDCMEQMNTSPVRIANYEKIGFSGSDGQQ